MRRGASLPPPDFAQLFAALPVAVLLVDPDDRIAFANSAAEELLNRSARLMAGEALASVAPPPAGHRAGHNVAAYDLEVETPRGHQLRLDWLEAELGEHPGWRAVTLHPLAPRRLGHAGGARAVVAQPATLLQMRHDSVDLDL